MVLVTGGTGLVGAHLLYYLLGQNENITAICRTSSNLEAVKKVFSYYTENAQKLFERINWIPADINDLPALSKAFKGVSHVYHCAALISFDTSDYQEMRKVNIEGTANIVNLCILNRVKKLCFVSSIAAVGKSLSRTEITEDVDWQIEENNYGYAITKYGAEMEVWRASQEEIEVVIVNPGIILGPGFWHSGSGKLFTNIYHGFRFYTEGITAYVDVIDVVKSMIQLMQSNIKNERYILVAKNDSFKNVFFAIADGFRKKRPSLRISRLITGLFWRFSWVLSKITGKKPFLTKQSAKSGHNKHIYSNKKIRDAIGYKFEALANTIENTCNCYLRDL